ncbi:MAG: flavin reductase family protein [Aigarchaeota archaeon]|nr:flavin reductase family protein [Aigarchaeota archaeon]MCX8193513.1 flavin reductase family protein [Nitrososphaeria archaeon]MDW7986816.1 flavin reductase family protein [Nitrososphaerota archaeon]
MGFIEVKPRSFVYLLQPKPVAIIVSVDVNGKSNGMSAAWLTPTSRDPPLLAVAISPKRYTYELIKQSRDFTVNILDSSMVDEAELFGSLSGRDVDKFKKSKLTLVKSNVVKSPHIAEALTAIECTLYNEYSAGDHQLIIGRVEKVYVREGVLEEDVYDISKAKVLLYLGGGSYTTTIDRTLTR